MCFTYLIKLFVINAMTKVKIKNINNSPRRAAFCRASICPIDKGLKLQAPSSKLQAPSSKLQACDKLSRVIMSH